MLTPRRAPPPQAEEPSRVAEIWEAYHSERPGVAGAALAASEHAVVVQRAAESPLFVFPVRRERGHFLLLSQYEPKSRIFAMTFLDDYKANPQLAPPWVSLHLFDELLQSKQLALARVEADASRLTTGEAEALLLLVRRYYGTDSYDRAWTFNHAPRHFDMDAYLASCP